MSKFHYLIDAGHGGVTDGGTYTTCPNWKCEDPSTWYKMFVHDGEPIFEGETNRCIANYLAQRLSEKKINFSFIHDSLTDTSLSHRVNIADQVHAANGRCVYISIHSNAGGGRGIEVFTSPGQTRSDRMAEYIYGVYDNAGKWKMRKDHASDGDNDKEAPFYVLRKTDCPAILVELLFFDDREEAKILKSREGQFELADLLSQGIELIEKHC